MPEESEQQRHSRSGDETERLFSGWLESIRLSIDLLRLICTRTEDEFLEIGSKLHEFYSESSEINETANHLVDLVSGEISRNLLEPLRKIISEMESYLGAMRYKSAESFEILEKTLSLLNDVDEPLENFNKMYKTLRMLSISTKIESARLGEKGADFRTLAIDVEKLSHQVSEKSESIMLQSEAISRVIRENLRTARNSETSRDTEVSGILSNCSENIESMAKSSEKCALFGSLLSRVSSEISMNISEVVSSMQAHDITRQQIEHIIEALERLCSSLEHGDAVLDRHELKKLITETGDISELQVAQLRHASSEMNSAVIAIIDNLRDIAGKQSSLARESREMTLGENSQGDTLTGRVKRGMATVAEVLADCSETDAELSGIMGSVAGTIGEISGFVTDIKSIGTEIDLIALNSQIKAAHTGSEGAALGVLAEAIKRLSLDAVNQTGALSGTLLKINEITSHLLSDSSNAETESSADMIELMKKETVEAVKSIEKTDGSINKLLSSLSEKVEYFSCEIGNITTGIDVHEKVASLADRVISSLEDIVAKSRELVPASSEFKANLRHMEERYTMESERHIHESIAGKKHGLGSGKIFASGKRESQPKETSEYGDNVELF